MPSRLPVDEGLAGRFRAAGRAIVWREEGKGRRVAHLHEQEARIAEGGEREARVLWAESAPVGALVLLLEIERRGLPDHLESVGEHPDFPEGALRATWGGERPTTAATSEAPRLEDLVALARYALP